MPRVNPAKKATAPYEQVFWAIEKAWGVTVGRKDLGGGADGRIYAVRRGNARGLVVKIMKANASTKLEAALTDLILTRQREEDNAENPYRVLFPAVVSGLVLIDGIINKVAWYVTLREDVTPVEKTYKGKKTPKAKSLLRAAAALWEASEAITSSVADPTREDSLDEGLANLAEAEFLAPNEMRGIGDAIQALADDSLLLWDMHDGNWGLRKQTLPKWPPPGRFVAMDYGRSSITDDDVYDRALALAHLSEARMNPSRFLRTWRRIRL